MVSFLLVAFYGGEWFKFKREKGNWYFDFFSPKTKETWLNKTEKVKEFYVCMSNMLSQFFFTSYALPSKTVNCKDVLSSNLRVFQNCIEMLEINWHNYYLIIRKLQLFDSFTLLNPRWIRSSYFQTHLIAY